MFLFGCQLLIPLFGVRWYISGKVNVYTGSELFERFGGTKLENIDAFILYDLLRDEKNAFKMDWLYFYTDDEELKGLIRQLEAGLTSAQ